MGEAIYEDFGWPLDRSGGRCPARPGWCFQRGCRRRAPTRRRPRTTRWSRSARSTSPRAGCSPRSTARRSSGLAIRVRRAFGLGPRELVAPALVAGLVDLVPEYAGTAVQFLSLGTPTARRRRRARPHAALVRALEGGTPPHCAPPRRRRTPTRSSSPRETAGATRPAHAERSARAVASQLTFGGPPECATRPLCLVGLRKVYGVRFEEFVPLDAGGPLTRQALRTGNVDVALLFTTDPAIATRRPRRAASTTATSSRRRTSRRSSARGRSTASGRAWSTPLDDVSARLDHRRARDLNAQVATATSAGGRGRAWLDAEDLP